MEDPLWDDSDAFWVSIAIALICAVIGGVIGYLFL